MKTKYITIELTFNNGGGRVFTMREKELKSLKELTNKYDIGVKSIQIIKTL